MKYALVLIALAALAAPRIAKADTTYTYTGNPFTSFQGSFACPPECGITATLTFSQPLPANLSPTDNNVTPTAFSFTDGNLTLSSGSAGVFGHFRFFSTDALGNITEWVMDAQISGSPIIATAGNNSPGFVVSDFSFNGGTNTNLAENLNVPGTWSSAPEPSSLIMLGTGMLALVGAKRRKWGGK